MDAAINSGSLSSFGNFVRLKKRMNIGITVTTGMKIKNVIHIGKPQSRALGIKQNAMRYAKKTKLMRAIIKLLWAENTEKYAKSMMSQNLTK